MGALRQLSLLHLKYDFMSSGGIPLRMMAGLLSFNQTSRGSVSRLVRATDSPGFSTRLMAEHQFKILLVEDDAPTRQFMKLLLKSQGYEVLEAEDGVQGYEVAKANTIDLVLSDVMMPNMNGIDLCRKIKDTPSMSLLPVILLTALSQDNDRLAGLEAGADDFLTKPVNEAELRIRLRNFRRVVSLQDQVRQAKQYAEDLVEKRTHEHVSSDAKAHGIPVNVVDSPELCTFIFPSIVDRSPLLIAISSSGRAPVMARRPGPGSA